MGGRSGQGLSTSKSEITSDSLTIYKAIVDEAIKEFRIKGTIKIVESKKSSDNGYAAPNISNYDNGGNPFRNEIRINPKTKNIEEVIRHELKHISQGQKGEYYQKKDENGVRYHYWKGEKVISSDEFRKINNNLSRGNNFAKYQSFPWEKDARSTQSVPKPKR